MVSATLAGPSSFCVYLDEVKINSVRVPSVGPLSHLKVFEEFKGTSDVIVAVSIMSDPYTTLGDCGVRVIVMEPE